MCLVYQTIYKALQGMYQLKFVLARETYGILHFINSKKGDIIKFLHHDARNILVTA